MISRIIRILPALLALPLVIAVPVPAQAYTSSPPSGLPSMGVNMWYVKGCNVTEADVLAEANNLVTSGLKAAGYQYVNLDDCWMAPQRAADGSLQADPVKFPHGIAWLANQVHALGLKFGIYESIGPKTCQSLPGSGGPSGTGGSHYAQDAQTFASWGVDFAKIDNCYTTGWSYTTLEGDFKTFGDDLRTANPNIVYSEELPICCIGRSNYDQSIEDSASISNQWRIWWDESASVPASTTILDHLAADLHLHGFAGLYHWNDMDMLVTGSPVFHWTLADEESQMSVWAEEASPLLISTDISQLTSAELSALKNQYMVAVDQSGQQAPKSTMSDNGSSCEELQKPYPGGGVAVLLANLGSSTVACEFTLADFGLPGPTANLFNVWTGKTYVMDHVGYTLGPYQTALWRVS